MIGIFWLGDTTPTAVSYALQWSFITKEYILLY
jgi:hypothetical protein